MMQQDRLTVHHSGFPKSMHSDPASEWADEGDKYTFIHQYKSIAKQYRVIASKPVPTITVSEISSSVAEIASAMAEEHDNHDDGPGEILELPPFKLSASDFGFWLPGSPGFGDGRSPPPTRKRSSRQSDCSQVAHISRVMLKYGTSAADNARHQELFDRVICAKIMPMAVRFQLHIENSVNAIVSASWRFPPLFHAVCAITLLDCGLRDRPELLAGSFQHYDRAISACRDANQEDPEAKFLLHFLLLIYDIGCTSQRWPQDRTYWAFHMTRLADIIYTRAETGLKCLEAYLTYYVLAMDAQAGLLGNLEAGNFVEAFFENDRWLPFWPVVSTANQRFSTIDVFQTFMKAHRLAIATTELYAEQCQLALRIRRSMENGTANADVFQPQIEFMGKRQDRTWRRHASELLDGQNEEVFLTLVDPIVSAAYTFYRSEYATLSLFLRASTYPGQRHPHMIDTIRHEQHCRHILDFAYQNLQSGETENYHLARGLLIAGCSSTREEDRKQALFLLSALDRSALPGAMKRVRELLEFVQHEQDLRRARGEDPNDFDWIGMMHAQGLKYVVLGM